jgi:hypothetical protein
MAEGHHRRHFRFAAGDRAAAGALEDDVHHLRVVVRHDGARVTAVEGEIVRLPWTMCAGSVDGLTTLVGTRLADARDLGAAYDAQQHCTHFFDLAQLTIAHAARGPGAREYRCTVVLPDSAADADDEPAGEDRVRAVVTRDGVAVHEWDVRGGTIVSAGPFAGCSLRTGFRDRWRALPDDDAEAALVLRRAVWMSPIRHMRLDDYEAVAATGVSTGACFTTQPGRIEVAFRRRGTQQDYDAAPDALLGGFTEWSERQLHA